VKILGRPPEERSEDERKELRAHSDPGAPEGNAGRGAGPGQAERDELDGRIPRRGHDELPRPRDTFMLERGQYDKLGARSARACRRACPRSPAMSRRTAWSWPAGWSSPAPLVGR